MLASAKHVYLRPDIQNNMIPAGEKLRFGIKRLCAHITVAFGEKGTPAEMIFALCQRAENNRCSSLLKKGYIQSIFSGGTTESANKNDDISLSFTIYLKSVIERIVNRRCLWVIGKLDRIRMYT